MKGGACCTVSSCKNSTSKKGVKFFRFPNPREPERSRRWIIACNRKDLLDKDPYYLYKNRRICSAHFPDSMYLNDLKNRLISTAEPILNLGFTLPNTSTDIGIRWTHETNVFRKNKKATSKESNNYFTFTPKARVVNCENSTSTLLDIDLRSYNLNEHPSMDNLSRICIVCFMEDNVHDIFHLKFDKLFISDIVKLHTTIQLHQDGTVPHKMCIPCIEELTKSYLFFKKLQNANKVLNEIALKDKVTVLNKSLQNHDDYTESLMNQNYDININSNYTDSLENIDQNQSMKYEIEVVEELYENSLDFNVMSDFNEHINLNEEIITFDNNLIIDSDDTRGPTSELSLSYNSQDTHSSALDIDKGQENFFYEQNQVDHNISTVSCYNDTESRESTGNKKMPIKLHCDRCKKCFSSMESFKNHVRKHQNPRRVTCYQCNKTYSSKTALKIHFLTHTGEKPFKCEFCAIQFRQHSHYITHKRTHTGEKPFLCHHCSSSFASTGLLDMHVRKKHTNHPICTCGDCGQGFFEKRMLKKHQIVKHGEKFSSHNISKNNYKNCQQLKYVHKYVNLGE